MTWWGPQVDWYMNWDGQLCQLTCNILAYTQSKTKENYHNQPNIAKRKSYFILSLIHEKI